MYDTITSGVKTSHYCNWFLPISNQRTILLPCFQLLLVLQIHLGEVSDATQTHAIACQKLCLILYPKGSGTSLRGSTGKGDQRMCSLKFDCNLVKLNISTNN